MALPGRSTAELCAIASSLACTEEPRGASEPRAYPQNGSPAAPPPGSAMASEQKPKEPFFLPFCKLQGCLFLFQRLVFILELIIVDNPAPLF